MSIMVIRININIEINIIIINIIIIIIIIVIIIHTVCHKHMQSTYILAKTHANHLNKCKIRCSSHVYSHVHRGTSDSE